MADIELAIKISEEEYEMIVNSEDCGLHTLTRAIAHGTILPKGHGRLIDADSLRQDLFCHRYSDTYCEEHNIDCSISMGMVGILIGDAQTIIEAESEDK